MARGQAQAPALTQDEINALWVEQQAAESAAKKAEFIANGYIPCAITGCSGLVAPKYQQEFMGTKVGQCPRWDAHARIRRAQKLG